MELEAVLEERVRCFHQDLRDRILGALLALDLRRHRLRSDPLRDTPALVTEPATVVVRFGRRRNTQERPFRQLDLSARGLFHPEPLVELLTRLLVDIEQPLLRRQHLLLLLELLLDFQQVAQLSPGGIIFFGVGSSRGLVLTVNLAFVLAGFLPFQV